MTAEPKPLKGRAAVVTGVRRGVGRVIALELARRGAGVAFNYAQIAEAAEALRLEIEKAGVRTLANRCDVADTEAAAEMVRQVKDEFGRVDFLANNARVTRDTPRFYGPARKSLTRARVVCKWKMEVGSGVSKHLILKCLYPAQVACEMATKDNGARFALAGYRTRTSPLGGQLFKELTSSSRTRRTGEPATKSIPKGYMETKGCCTPV